MLSFPWILVFGLTSFLQIKTVATDGLCRTKYGSFAPAQFDMHACAWCYQFITQSLEMRVSPTLHSLVVVGNQSIYPQWTILVPDAENASLANRVCKTISRDTCSRWKSCCSAARSCCKRQLLLPPRQNGSCPRTWDGYGCWDDTRPETAVYISCPSFLQFSSSSRYAKKQCNANGNWFMLGNQTKLNEWTDYNKCFDKESLLVLIYLGLACNSASVVLLVPAIAIFLLYRSLRRQHRIRLHINFFAALLFADVVNILWEMLVSHNQIMSSNNFDIGASCKVLSFLRLYSRSTTYVWMFCEGFYLHRLISNAFKPPKSLLFLYITGWGLPFVYTSIYGLIRIIYDNETCWAKSYGQLQWILYVPNLLCLAVNFFFLFNILRILLTQLKSHPNEPSNFRRALKATFVLIPLFGVQLFVTVYRLPAGTHFSNVYEKFTVFVLNSQGFFVALIFCFFNGEVITHMKRTCTRLKIMRPATESMKGQTTATSVNFVQHGQDSNESENGNLVNGSPRRSPASGKKLYNSMELSERRYPYIPLAVRNTSQSPSPTEI